MLQVSVSDVGKYIMPLFNYSSTIRLFEDAIGRHFIVIISLLTTYNAPDTFFGLCCNMKYTQIQSCGFVESYFDLISFDKFLVFSDLIGSDLTFGNFFEKKIHYKEKSSKG